MARFRKRVKPKSNGSNSLEYEDEDELVFSIVIVYFK